MKNLSIFVALSVLLGAPGAFAAADGACATLGELPGHKAFLDAFIAKKWDAAQVAFDTFCKQNSKKILCEVESTTVEKSNARMREYAGHDKCAEVWNADRARKPKLYFITDKAKHKA